MEQVKFHFREEETVLILSRRELESICLGDDVILTVVAVGKDKVRIGVQAPPGVRILRHELEVNISEQGVPLAFPQPEREPLSATDKDRADRRRAA